MRFKSRLNTWSPKVIVKHILILAMATTDNNTEFHALYESIDTVGEIRVWWRADFQSPKNGSLNRDLLKFFE